MSGLCMCGDPYCSSCGSPGAAAAEAAEEWAIERLAEAKLTPEEYELVITIGLASLDKIRNHIDSLRKLDEATKQTEEPY